MSRMLDIARLFACVLLAGSAALFAGVVAGPMAASGAGAAGGLAGAALLFGRRDRAAPMGALALPGAGALAALIVAYGSFGVGAAGLVIGCAAGLALRASLPTTSQNTGSDAACVGALAAAAALLLAAQAVAFADAARSVGSAPEVGLLIATVLGITTLASPHRPALGGALSIMGAIAVVAVAVAAGSAYFGLGGGSLVALVTPVSHGGALREIAAHEALRDTPIAFGDAYAVLGGVQVAALTATAALGTLVLTCLGQRGAQAPVLPTGAILLSIPAIAVFAVLGGFATDLPPAPSLFSAVTLWTDRPVALGFAGLAYAALAVSALIATRSIAQRIAPNTGRLALAGLVVLAALFASGFSDPLEPVLLALGLGGATLLTPICIATTPRGQTLAAVIGAVIWLFVWQQVDILLAGPMGAAASVAAAVIAGRAAPGSVASQRAASDNRADERA